MIGYAAMEKMFFQWKGKPFYGVVHTSLDGEKTMCGKRLSGKPGLISSVRGALSPHMMCRHCRRAVIAWEERQEERKYKDRKLLDEELEAASGEADDQ